MYKRPASVFMTFCRALFFYPAGRNKMKIEELNNDDYEVKLTIHEMGLVSELILDGLSYNRNNNYEMRKLIKNETDLDAVKNYHDAHLLIYEKLTAGEIIAQTFYDALPKATITPRKDI